MGIPRDAEQREFACRYTTAHFLLAQYFYQMSKVHELPNGYHRDYIRNIGIIVVLGRIASSDSGLLLHTE